MATTRTGKPCGNYKREKRNTRWPIKFIEALARTSNVTQSAKEAGTDVSTVYRKRREDARFARLWAAALLEGYAHLELETLERLRHGTPADGPKFDIANALRLLTLHKETVARERAREEMEDEEEILASIERKIDAMRARERESAQLLAETTDESTFDDD